MSRALAHTLVVAILAALLAIAFWRSGYAFQWEGVWAYRQKFAAHAAVCLGQTQP